MRRHLIKVLALGLLVSLTTHVSISFSSAVETVTKTVNVKSLAGSNYQNALVKAIYYKKSDGLAGASELVTTDASGNATITYNTDIDYGYIVIEPALGDTTHAMGVIQNIQVVSNSSLSFTLKKAHVQFKILNTDDSDAAVGTEFSIANQSFQILRTGVFGINGDELSLNWKSNSISVNPVQNTPNQLQNTFYFNATKTDTGWSYKVYSNAAKTSEVAPIDGIQVVKFRAHTVQVTIKNSDGSSLTVPDNSSTYGQAFRVDANGDEIWEQFGDNSYAQISSSGVWQGALGVSGRYPLMFGFYNSDTIPSFYYGNLWSNGSGLVSNVSASTGFPSPGQVLNIDVTLPATFLAINYKDRDTGLLTAFSASINKKIGTAYSGYTGFVNNIWSTNGKAAISLPDGDYKFTIGTFVEVQYFVNVTSGVYSVTDATNTTLVPTDGKYTFFSGIANLKMKASSNGSALQGLQGLLTKTGSDNDLYAYSDEAGNMRRKIDDGEYSLLLLPSGLETPIRAPNKYLIKVSNGVVTEFKAASTGISVTIDANGFYPITLAEPKVTGSVTLSGTTFPINGGFNLTPYKVDSIDIKQVLTVAKHSRVAVSDSGIFGTILDPGTYRFAVRSDVFYSKIYTTVSECVIPTSQVANCSINIPAENLNFNVKSQNGDLLRGDFYVQLEQLKELSGSIPGFVNPDPESGLITGHLADGNYLLTLTPYSSETEMGVSKSFRLTIANALVTRMVDIVTDVEVAPVNGVYPLYLQKTNFRGVLKNGGIAVSNASVSSQNLQGKASNSWSSTNSVGKFNLYLAEGSNQVTVRPRGDENPSKSPNTYTVVVTNGVVTSVKDASGSDITAIEGFYPMGFESPNVSGQVTLGGEAQSGVLYAQKLDASGKYFQWTNDYASISATSGYGIKLDPGKYTFTVYLSNRQTLVTDICEVPVTGNVTCAIAFPAANLKFSVSNITGTKLGTGFYTNPEFKTSSGASAGSCCMYPTAGIQLQELSLINGTHQITINPDGSLPVTNMANTYTVTVAGGVVTSVLEGRSLTPISPNADGIYSFKFVAPGLSGTVVAYDGTTPVPNAQVQLTNQGNWLGAGTSSSGTYAIGYMSDGQYELWAYPSAQDITQFRSDIQTVTVLNGVVSNQVVLQLTKPNVSGTVSGPTGLASKYNWLNVRKLDSNGYYQYIEKMPGRGTNGVGKFSYLLAPGTYIFEVNADTSVQGVRTTSAPCVVVAGADKVCDITMASANLKFKVTNSANASLPNSSGWYWLTEKVSDVVSRDGWMSIDGNGNSQVYLEDGTWYLRIDPPYNNAASSTANFRVIVSNGVVTSVKDLTGNQLAASDGVYNFQLPSGNLIGDITVSGNKTTLWNSVSVKAWNGTSYNEIMNRGFQDGSFGFKVDPGLYRVEARPNGGADSTLSTTKSAVCEVFETGTTTCNIALQNANLLGTVKTSSGDVFKEVWGYIYSANDKNEYWEQSVNFYDGKFATYLENGTYRLRIEPYWEKRSLFPAQDYTVVIAGGVVTQITNRNTAAVLAASADRYTFTLSAPSVAGYVYMPGVSTEKVPNIQVSVFDSSGKERWEYSTTSDAAGKFGLNLPDGTYDLIARPWGSGRTYTTSAKMTLTVTAGTVAGGDITLRLRAPNVWGVIVRPDGTTPLAEVNINMYMNGEYAYAWTGTDGSFGAYFDNAIPSPCNNCQININHYNNSDYSAKNYSFSATGNLGNLAIGGVNAKVTVLYPESGGATSPSKWGYVAIEELDGSNYIWQPGAGTNELGKAGLSLTAGKTYRITAYPGWERGADFVPKTTTITSFDPSNAAHIAFTITFATPNISFFVKDRASQANSWGWYQINKLNESTSAYEYYVNGYLNDQGRGSQLLASNGTYQITFWPGKASGIEKTISVVVLEGVVKLNDSILTATTTVVLPTGNVSGRILSAPNTPVQGATVAAVRVDDPTKLVSTIALSDGTFELGLDLTYAWDIKALDPITGKLATRNLPIVDGRASNATVAVSDITVLQP